MDSRGWIFGLAAAAGVLAALLIVDLARSPAPPPGGRIVPEWDARTARSIRFERSGGSIVLERAPAAPSSPPEAGWSLRLPASGAAPIPVDPSALRELFGTIEMLAAIRRDGGEVAAPRLTLVIEPARGSPIRLAIEAGAGPTDRAWLARAGQGGRCLIDGYAARALDMSADDLRERRPLRGRLDRLSRVEIAAGDRAAVLTGPPWRIALPGGSARAAPARVQDLLDWAARLRIAEFTRGEPGAPDVRLTFTAKAGRSEIAYVGACPGGAGLAETPVGRGCLPRRDDLTTLAGTEPWIDRDLVGAPIDQVAHLRLERGGRALELPRADSPEALRDWLARWREAAAGPTTVDALVPVAALELELDGDRRERIEIGRAGDRLAARREGEPVALLLQPWADAHLDPSPYRVRSLDLLASEPSALRAAEARRGAHVIEAIERGDTLEEWRARVPAGAAVSAAAIDSLRQAVGYLRAERFAAGQARPGHGLSPPRRTVQLVFDPPPGGAEPERHAIDVGGPAGAGGCYARLDRDPPVFELSAARCAALLGPWTQLAR